MSCMYWVPHFASVFVVVYWYAMSVLVRLRRVRATALKPTHKAGRRGGVSIAR